MNEIPRLQVDQEYSASSDNDVSLLQPSIQNYIVLIQLFIILLS